MNIEFVSYTGRYPNLCSGVLTLRINGEEKSFGHNYLNWDYTNDDNYDSFWASGGNCEDSYVTSGEWIINKEELPKYLQPYVAIIRDIFNENVSLGCCGGCL